MDELQFAFVAEHTRHVAALVAEHTRHVDVSPCLESVPKILDYSDESKLFFYIISSSSTLSLRCLVCFLLSCPQFCSWICWFRFHL